MSDLKRYIKKRKKTDKDFAEDYDVGYVDFKKAGFAYTKVYLSY